MKTALVTGGAGGIGSAICTGLARAGCQVAVHYNTKKETAEALAAQLQKSCGIKAIAVQADIKDRESVNRMFDKVDKSLGGVDILVNNAGIAQQKSTLTSAAYSTAHRKLCGGTCCPFTAA